MLSIDLLDSKYLNTGGDTGLLGSGEDIGL